MVETYGFDLFWNIVDSDSRHERVYILAKRVIIVVCDSMGVGEMKDAAKFGDAGANTLSNIAKNYENFHIPNFKKLGLANIDGVEIEGIDSPIASYGKMEELSSGKDTTSGHWEMMGLVTEADWPTYPNGFPPEIMNAFEEKIGRKTLGNYPASGTDILNSLGEEHMKTGSPIIYTSADSVFQIACHEDIIPIEEIYKICEIARELLVGKHAVARVIARPFLGKPGSFKRTTRRHDYSVIPGITILNHLMDEKLTTYAVGKISDIFAGCGISDHVGTISNMDGVDKTLEAMDKTENGIIFTNLVDFDMLFGHRRDAVGYAEAIIEFDKRIPEIMEKLKDDDVLIITADHGCDPTYIKHTDHTREYVPLIIYGKNIVPVSLGTLNSFSTLGKFVHSYLSENKELNKTFSGEDIISKVKNW